MTELRFEGRTALVTGAGGGLGRCFALALATRGCRVLVNDLGSTMDGTGIERSPADGVCGEIEALGGLAAPDHGNVVEDSDAIVRSAIDVFGSLDIVVNAAGVLDWRPFGEGLRPTRRPRRGSSA